MIKKLFFGLLFMLISFYGISVKAQTGKEIPELYAVDYEIGSFIEKWNLPGASVALVKDGKLVYARAFGKADVNIIMEPDHLFRIASLSKPITAIAIMKLAEEGALHLEDHVFGVGGILNGKYYQEIADSRVKDITIRHLLQHTAGWDRNFGKEGDPMFNTVEIAKAMGVPAPAGQVDVIRYMLTKELDFTPGSRFSYSNLGYNVLGRIIEKVSGLTYEAYVQQHVLDPLEILNVSLGCNVYENKLPREVVYHDFQKFQVASVCEDGKQTYYPYGGFNLEAMDAHGGWVASATDLAKIIVASNGLGSSKDLISAASVKEMMTPSFPTAEYGLGWCVNKQGNRWHTGSLKGASSMMASLNNGISWVMLFNGNPLSAEYFQSMDRVMWNALGKIKEWPTDDLFLAPQDVNGDFKENMNKEELPDLL